MTGRLALGCVVAAAVAATGCNTPVPFLRIGPTDGPIQSCGSSECADVMLLCNALMSIRIVDPKAPAIPLLSQCSIVRHNSTQLCAVAGVELQADPLPVRELDVEVALFPNLLGVDEPKPSDCPAVRFNLATGFPVEQTPAPALGGRATYHPGDAVVDIRLGCTNLDAINNQCTMPQTAVTATVNDFPTQVQVAEAAGAALRVEVGEPHAVGDTHVIDDTVRLQLRRDAPIATWDGVVTRKLDRYICVDVLEDKSAATKTLSCTETKPGASLMMTGAWLKAAQLAEYLRALGLTSVPNEGLTVGVVVDRNMSPVAGATVALSSSGLGPPGPLGTVQYLTKNRLGLTSTATSDNGVFLSTNAAFGTEFTAHALNMSDAIGVGGLVTARVTIVVLVLESAT